MPALAQNDKRARSARHKIERKFPTETAAQKALHLDIAVKYDKQQRRRRRAWPDDLDPSHRPNLVLNLRMADLELLFLDNWGDGIIQDDDAGRDDIYIAAQHIAQHGAPEQRIPAWLHIWAPWYSAEDTAKLIKGVKRRPVRWKATTLGVRMGVTIEQRKRLRLKTIRAAGDSDAEIAKNASNKRTPTRPRPDARPVPHRAPSTRPHQRRVPSHGKRSASARARGSGEASRFRQREMTKVRHVTKVRGH
jgi:hypothetical protein